MRKVENRVPLLTERKRVPEEQKPSGYFRSTYLINCEVRLFTMANLVLINAINCFSVKNCCVYFTSILGLQLLFRTGSFINLQFRSSVGLGHGASNFHQRFFFFFHLWPRTRTGSMGLAILLSAWPCCRLSWEWWLHPHHLLAPALLGCCWLQLTSISPMTVLQPPLLCKGWGGCSLHLSGDSSVVMDFCWPCDLYSSDQYSVQQFSISFFCEAGSLHWQQQHWQGWNQFGMTGVFLSVPSYDWCTPLSHPSSCMLVNHEPLQKSFKEYKLWKRGVIARCYASHTKTMLPTRKSMPRSSRQLDHTQTSWPS